MKDLKILEQAVAEGKLLTSSLENIKLLLNGTQDPVAPAAVEELVQRELWDELNNRFYKTLAFGTGGLRGRTIGTVVASAEQGEGAENGRPSHRHRGAAPRQGQPYEGAFQDGQGGRAGISRGGVL